MVRMQRDSSWDVAPERKPPPGESGEARFRTQGREWQLVRSGGGFVVDGAGTVGEEETCD